jgi:hypothetical protein
MNSIRTRITDSIKTHYNIILLDLEILLEHIRFQFSTLHIFLVLLAKLCTHLMVSDLVAPFLCYWHYFVSNIKIICITLPVHFYTHHGQ